jgi:hypothetical protein
MRIVICFLLVALFGAIHPLSAQLINEVQASNLSTVADEDGVFSDWIELRNPTASPIRLLGYGLSDNVNVPFKWVLPDVTIPAGAYLLVFASGKDRRDPSGTLHTNYSLSADGEAVMLTAPNGTRVDLFPGMPQYTGISYGRTATGFGYFAQPTPRVPNTTTSYPQMVEKPVFSPIVLLNRIV